MTIMFDAKIINKWFLGNRQRFQLLERLENNMSLQEVKENARDYENSYPENIIFIDLNMMGIFMLEDSDGC